MLPYIICAVLFLAVLALTVKIALMKKSLGEFCTSIEEQLSSDVNTPLTLSSRDKHVLAIAARLSRELSELRRQRKKYLGGKGELEASITNLSHDLRTPLTAVFGYLLLLEKENMSADAKRYLSYIAERAETMKDLTEELFRYSLVSTAPGLTPEILDLGCVLEDTLLSFLGAFEKRGITPEITLPEGSVLRKLDKSALKRIIGNIVSNALRYSDSDFSVSLDSFGKMVFSNSAGTLSRIDAGRLFDRFYTVSSAGKSTGLGLSIAKLLTEEMGGKIGAEKRAGVLYISVEFPE